jgi:hypothetical protein
LNSVETRLGWEIEALQLTQDSRPGAADDFFEDMVLLLASI